MFEALYPGVALRKPASRGNAMLNIDWRSPAAYQFAKSISAAGFAWEYLRRDDDYRREFQAITASGEPDPERLEAFVKRWGLRFSNRS